MNQQRKPQTELAPAADRLDPEFWTPSPAHLIEPPAMQPGEWFVPLCVVCLDNYVNAFNLGHAEEAIIRYAIEHVPCPHGWKDDRAVATQIDIAERTRLNRNTVHDHIKQLQADGLIEAHFPRGHTGWIRAAHYSKLVVIPKPHRQKRRRLRLERIAKETTTDYRPDGTVRRQRIREGIENATYEEWAGEPPDDWNEYEEIHAHEDFDVTAFEHGRLDWPEEP